MRSPLRIGLSTASCVLCAVFRLIQGQDGGVEPLPPVDQAVLDDFSAAVKRFEGLSLPEFLAEHGPKKAYLEAEEAMFVRSNVNGDGNINITDPICTLHSLFFGGGDCAHGECADAMDADDSGILDITDGIFTFSYLFLGGREPPAPFPRARSRPTPGATTGIGPYETGAVAIAPTWLGSCPTRYPR